LFAPERHGAGRKCPWFCGSARTNKGKTKTHPGVQHRPKTIRLEIGSHLVPSWVPPPASVMSIRRRLLTGAVLRSLCIVEYNTTCMSQAKQQRRKNDANKWAWGLAGKGNVGEQWRTSVRGGVGVGKTRERALGRDCCCEHQELVGGTRLGEKKRRGRGGRGSWLTDGAAQSASVGAE